MRRTPLVHAKAHLSELGAEAEHEKKPVIIMRHGKPAAAIVPVDAVTSPKRAAPRPMSAEESRALLDELAASAPESTMTIEEALGRNRLVPLSDETPSQNGRAWSLMAGCLHRGLVGSTSTMSFEA